jgi:uncharacterized membrane protein YeaQ/YmgE (transglycosylase-associated protein family)
LRDLPVEDRWLVFREGRACDRSHHMFVIGRVPTRHHGTELFHHCYDLHGPHRADEGHIMGIVILLVVGGVIGWLASIVMRTDGQQGIFLNIVVGIIGSFLAGLLLTPYLGGAPITAGAFDLKSIGVSFLGAIVLLAIVNLVRRGSVR